MCRLLATQSLAAVKQQYGIALSLPQAKRFFWAWLDHEGIHSAEAALAVL
jgi:hypothetical protein